MDKTIPAPAARLLDFIGGVEAPKGYDTIYGNKQHKLPKPITSMTLDELIERQPAFTRNFGSSASGRYQFMRATLLDLKQELGLRGSQVFDADLQDRLGYHLLRRRGYDKWIAGRLSDAAFMLGLAKEWASLPVPTATQGGSRKVQRGQSFYAGDGLNKALVSVQRVESVLAMAYSLRDPKPKSSRTGTVIGGAIATGGAAVAVEAGVDPAAIIGALVFVAAAVGLFLFIRSKRNARQD